MSTGKRKNLDSILEEEQVARKRRMESVLETLPTPEPETPPQDSPHNQSLLAAILENNVAAVQEAVKSGANVNAANNGLYAIHFAASIRDSIDEPEESHAMEIINILNSTGQLNLYSLTEEGQTALHLAVMNEEEAVVDFLLLNASLSYINRRIPETEETALQLAAENQHISAAIEQRIKALTPATVAITQPSIPTPDQNHSR